MKKALPIFLSFLATASLVAQNCQPVMPNVSYKVYDADITHSNSGDILWVCQGVTIEISGDGNTAFIEKNCDVTLSGDGNTVYVKRAGSLTVTGDNNPKVLYETGVTFSNSGSGNSPASCDTLKYDYTDAPVAPDKFCDVFASVEEFNSQQQFDIYPNPTNGKALVQIPSKERALNAEVYSTTGQLVRKVSMKDNEIDLSNLETGLYMVLVRTENKLFSGNVQVE
ncbi:MAG: T9SS type A sorting domain-containing protein [Vicingaceae bacterium]